MRPYRQRHMAYGGPMGPPLVSEWRFEASQRSKLSAVTLHDFSGTPFHPVVDDHFSTITMFNLVQNPPLFRHHIISYHIISYHIIIDSHKSAQIHSKPHTPHNSLMTPDPINRHVFLQININHHQSSLIVRYASTVSC